MDCTDVKMMKVFGIVMAIVPFIPGIAYLFLGIHDWNTDEQALHLAPEKRDFTATYTLGATMRQITYY